ncbi:Smad nuclear-interacting protein 1 [Lasiodiplodia hormozganensis]|uniref:Smad nuclear-interacting protein 1 n=1 Tax=Lasiodiplodia hormozganensis TaxID=869390 RepID=A0AA39WT44_9PEZI|nr:Smad nuclear-interacting protein 1 [Lasiodiplodia hormozganensis]
MPADSVSPPPRARRHSLSDDDDNSRRNDGARDRHRRKRSPDDENGKHRRSRRPRDDNDDSAARSDDDDDSGERAARQRRRDRSREGRRRSKSRSRSKHRHRSRSKDAARDRYERKRRYDDRSSSHHHHRSERRKDRDGSPRHSRRSRHARHDHRSRSRSPKRRRPSTSASPPRKRSAKPLPSQEAAYRGSGDGSGEAAGEPVVEKQKPNFKQTGLLAREANTVAGTDIVLKYNEPPDARKPPARDDWRLFVFKGQDCLQTVELGSRSCWLVGREAAVADLLVEHPSTSKQHAVLQFRHTTRVNEYGDKDARVRPYLIDLESSNGTILNGKQIEATRFVEVMDKDVVKFGLSEREYVLMLAKA